MEETTTRREAKNLNTSRRLTAFFQVNLTYSISRGKIR
jgi:hypothetical protein